jgi:multimeric flavodoxin WrbA
VVAFNGSLREDGNTTILINKVFQELEKEGIETEWAQLPGKEIRGCVECFKYIDNKDRRCAARNDTANECIVKRVLRIKQVVDDAFEVLEQFLKTCGVEKRKNPD